MRKSIKFSIIFSILLLNISILPVSAYWEIQGNYVIYDVSWNDGTYYYQHINSNYNSSVVYIQIYHNRSNFGGYSLRNPQHINTTIRVTLLMENGGAGNTINMEYSILQNLVEVYTIYDTLTERTGAPYTADYTQFVVTDDYLQREVVYNYVVLNITSNTTYTSEDYYFVIIGYSFFKAEIINYFYGSLFDSITTLLPVFLLIILFPLIFHKFPISKKLALIAGLFVSALTLDICNLIPYTISIVLYIASGLLAYYYIKYKRDELLNA